MTSIVCKSYNKYSILWNSQEAVYQIQLAAERSCTCIHKLESSRGCWKSFGTKRHSTSYDTDTAQFWMKSTVSIDSLWAVPKNAFCSRELDSGFDKIVFRTGDEYGFSSWACCQKGAQTYWCNDWHKLRELWH